MDLHHYARAPFTLDPAYKYQPGGVGKPTGLWVSDEDDYGWRDWCTDEQWGLDRLVYDYRVTLAKGAHVLIIDTLDDLASLNDLVRGGPMGPGYDDALAILHNLDPDWSRVSRHWDGVIISPYQWSARFDVRWYYGWDCASGCIWNLDAIEALTLVGTLTPESEDA